MASITGSWKAVPYTALEPKRVAQAAALYRIGFRRLAMRRIQPELDSYLSSYRTGLENYAKKHPDKRIKVPGLGTYHSRTLLFVADKFFAERKIGGTNYFSINFGKGVGFAAFLASATESYFNFTAIVPIHPKCTYEVKMHSLKAHTKETIILGLVGLVLYAAGKFLYRAMKKEAHKATVELEKNLRIAADFVFSEK